jgi:hypothetical protein
MDSRSVTNAILCNWRLIHKTQFSQIISFSLGNMSFFSFMLVAFWFASVTKFRLYHSLHSLSTVTLCCDSLWEFIGFHRYFFIVSCFLPNASVFLGKMEMSSFLKIYYGNRGIHTSKDVYINDDQMVIVCKAAHAPIMIQPKPKQETNITLQWINNIEEFCLLGYNTT